MKKKLIILSLLFLLTSNIASATAFDIVRPNDAYQDCVSLTVKYCNDNPGFIPTSVSNSKFFYGLSHFVAVKIIDNETILIHDELNNAEYESHNWFLDGQYYHFWIDEPIKRNYKFLLDNREMVLY